MFSFSRVGALLLLSAAALPAITITSITLQYNQADHQRGTQVNDLTAGGYLVAGDFDVYYGTEDTVNPSPIQTGTDFTGPFALRFTNALIACTNPLGCKATQLNFVAFLTFDGPAPTDVAGLFGISGEGSGDLFHVIAESGTEPLGFAQISNVSLDGGQSYSQSFAPGFLTSNASNSLILSVGIDFANGLEAGSSLSLPNSLFEQVGTMSDVPEPGTVGIVGAGLVGALWFRRRIS